MKPLIDSRNGGMGAVVVPRRNKAQGKDSVAGSLIGDFALFNFPQTDGVEQRCVNAKKAIGTLYELRLFSYLLQQLD
eukprot:scaffold69974_cov51-Attheya_sp.AAC.3